MVFPHVMKKRNRIISKLRSKYLTLTHKYGLRIRKSFKEAISLDKSICSTLWWEEIFQETKNAGINFELYEGNVEDFYSGYQEVSCHIIFDLNMGENLCHKY